MHVHSVLDSRMQYIKGLSRVSKQTRNNSDKKQYGREKVWWGKVLGSFGYVGRKMGHNISHMDFVFKWFLNDVFFPSFTNNILT